MYHRSIKCLKPWMTCLIFALFIKVLKLFLLANVCDLNYRFLGFYLEQYVITYCSGKIMIQEGTMLMMDNFLFDK